MRNLENAFENLDVRVTGWMARHGIKLLRISLGIVFFWFGVLKYFPGVSPAQELATRTISTMTFGLMPPNVSVVILATWECLIGLGLIFGVFMRTTLALMLAQMAGTVTPLLFFPSETFTAFPYGLTFEGQYIIKNVVLVSAGLVIGATVRGGRLMSEGEPSREEDMPMGALSAKAE